jgi:hypothetical protein
MSLAPTRAGAGLSVLVVAAALAGCAGSIANDPASNASEGNTPHVGARGTIEVAHLRWGLDAASVKTTIGQASSSLRARARGVYLIITLRVTNRGSEAVNLSENLVTLVTKATSYSVDSRAAVALLGEGHPAFLTESIEPRQSLSGYIAFDVAPSALRQRPSLRFVEPSFGSTQGFIDLPHNLG